MCSENNYSFAASLIAARKARGFTQRKAALIVSKTDQAISDWETGKYEPCLVTQNGVLAAIKESIQPPSLHFLRKAGRLHHISWEKDRGWFLRVTIQVGKKVVGSRIKVRLRTYDINEAIRARDVVLSSYKVMGFSVANVTGTTTKTSQRNTKQR